MKLAGKVSALKAEPVHCLFNSLTHKALIRFSSVLGTLRHKA